MGITALDFKWVQKETRPICISRLWVWLMVEFSLSSNMDFVDELGSRINTDTKTIL